MGFLLPFLCMKIKHYKYIRIAIGGLMAAQFTPGLFI
jgi:hypothetical protein